MTGSKSSQTTKNIIIVLLTLWSVVSLIIIVVWATSPDMKSSSQCREELQLATEKLEGAKVVWAKNKAALEEMVEELRLNQTGQREEIQQLRQRLASTNATLAECQQENVVLNGNISLLDQRVETLRDVEANLTAQIILHQDHIETLQQNLTQTFHQTQSCFSLNTAAESQTLAAQSLTRACQSSKQYLEKQLLKCKVVDKQASEQTAEDANASPHASIPALLLLLCTGLHLLT